MVKMKYTCRQGCCICGIKQNSSQFRLWSDFFSEEIYCLIFELTSMAGRRGWICNPCVLWMGRKVEDLERLGPHDLGGKQRLDSKLKGRRVKMDMYPDDFEQDDGLGFAARTLRVTPKYAFIGKKYFHASSKFQMIPAGPWVDPKEFLEDESDAEDDLPTYRRTTLKKGVKTLADKNKKKMEAEQLENRKLFGDPIEGDQRKEKSKQKKKKVSAFYLSATLTALSISVDDETDRESTCSKRRKVAVASTSGTSTKRKVISTKRHTVSTKRHGTRANAKALLMASGSKSPPGSDDDNDNDDKDKETNPRGNSYNSKGNFWSAFGDDFVEDKINPGAKSSKGKAPMKERPGSRPCAKSSSEDKPIMKAKRPWPVSNEDLDKKAKRSRLACDDNLEEKTTATKRLKPHSDDNLEEKTTKKSRLDEETDTGDECGDCISDVEEKTSRLQTQVSEDKDGASTSGVGSSAASPSPSCSSDSASMPEETMAPKEKEVPVEIKTPKEKKAPVETKTQKEEKPVETRAPKETETPIKTKTSEETETTEEEKTNEKKKAPKMPRKIRPPVKNFRRARVSFFDLSYFQKFVCCCFNLYVMEGGIVMRQLGTRECVNKKKNIPCDNSLTTNTMNPESKKTAVDSLLSLAGGRSSDDDKWELDSAKGAAASAATSTSGFQDECDFDDGCLMPAKHSSVEVVSELSSTDDDLTDARAANTASPDSLISAKTCNTKFFTQH